MILQSLGVSEIDKKLNSDMVECFVVWCGKKHFTLNLKKTKRTIVAFRRNRVRSNTVWESVSQLKCCRTFYYKWF